MLRRSSILALVLALMLLPLPMVVTTAQDATPTASPVAGQPLDLAAITLTPADLAVIGLEGYALGYTATLPPAMEAAFVADYRGVPVAEVTEALVGNGLEGTYSSFLELSTDTATPTDEPPRTVYSYVYAFADEAGAAAAHAYIENEPGEVVLAEDLPGAKTVGDESELTREVAPDAITGLPSTTLDLGFRAGNLTATAGVITFGDEEPTVGEVEALAERLLEKIEAARAGEAPGLSPLAMLFDNDVATVAQDRYLRINGEDIPIVGEQPDASERRARRYGDAAAVFVTSYGIEAGSEGTGDDTYIQTDLLRFADVTAASAFLRAAPDMLAAEPITTALEIRPDAPAFGDESVSFSYRTTRGNGLPAEVERIYTRVGDIVAAVYVGANEQPDPLVVEELAATQVACLEEGACPDILPVPAALLAGPEATPVP